MKNRNFFKCSYRNLTYLMIALSIITIFAFKFVEFANAYQPYGNNPYEKNNQENFYLNLDILDLNKQEVLFDINDVKFDMGKANGTISISLNYYPESNNDVDNDGIEKLNGVIDFSVGNTAFNWNADKGKLCTRWEIYSIDDDKLSTVCYGSDKCCKFVNLAPIRSSWSETLYLTYGMHSASENNVVNAQIIYVDYNLSKEKPYSSIYYSRWGSLPAVFRGDGIVISKISIEDALKNIEKIKNKNNNIHQNNRIHKIALTDKDGNELIEISPDKNISMVINISKTANNLAINDFSSKQENEVIISINSFNAGNADWNKTDRINITTQNKELTEALKEIGINPKTTVSVRGIENFLDGESYDGVVKLTATDYFNSIIYCSEDKISSCHFVQECSNEFKGAECYNKNDIMLTIHVPHFSTIIVALDNTIANLTINSPDNSTPLSSGENIYLNFTINESVNVNYSLDGQGIVALNSGTSFAALLSGTLPYGVLANGLHNLKVQVRDILGNGAIANYSFTVNDAAAPIISLNITNNSILSGESLILPVKIDSNEYTNIAYKINSNNFSSFIDLGVSKSKIININPVSGSNNLRLNATDLHYNSNLLYLSFNFTLAQAPSCSDAIQNGDETGLDCGGSCSACVPFNVTTNKISYNSTDNAYITVIARANSSVNVTILRQNAATYKHVFLPVFAGAPIAETRLIENTSNAGNYTINAIMFYLNITENKNAAFEVLSISSSSLSASINANATTTNEGNAILFTSTITGNATAVAYKWDFQNDGSIDSTIASPVYTYYSNGTFTVNLTVSDSKWNQTDIEVITVRKLYNVTIIVKDNSTSNPIENAEIELDNEFKNTSADGRVAYSRPAERYRLIVKKLGYAAFSNNSEISGNAIFEVNLLQEDNLAPTIQLISPEDKIIISNTSYTFRYKAFDSSSMTCKIYININSSPWRVYGINANVINNEESSFILADLKNNSYQWKIECIDKNGNSNFSEAYAFTVDTSLIENTLSVDLDEQDKSSEGIISEIDAIMASLDSLGTDEKEAAEAMQLRKNLEKSKIAIQRTNRDLHSLKWRRLNQTGLEQETQTILDRIENIKYTTPNRIEVIDKNEFVKYPNKEDVSKALEVFINTTNLKFTRKELNNLVQENHKLQSAITLTTKARLINVDYISGNKQTITLIQKLINAEKSSEKSFDNLVFFEIIPKDLAKNLSEMELLFDYEIIDNDPIVSIDVNKIKEFSYILNKRTSISDAEKLKSILLSKDLKSYKKSGNIITGFASFDRISTAFTSSDFVKTADVRLIAEFAIIAVLLIIFSYYQFGAEKLELLLNRKAKEKLKEFNYLMDKLSKYLNENKYEEARLLYKEIQSLFRDLPHGARKIVYGKIVDAHNRIDFAYMDNSLNEAIKCLENNKKERTMQLYAEISGLYKNLPKDYKSKIHVKCIELYKKLNS